MDVLHVVHHSFYVVQLCDNKVSSFNLLFRRNIKWLPPNRNFVKVNCDGAVTLFGAVAAVGGVIRNHQGEMLLGFSSHLGACSITEAELWAIFMGCKLAGLNGFTRGVVESDSLVAVKLLRDGCSSLHPFFNLVKNIQDLLVAAGEWSVSAHTLREGNQTADSFAKFGLSLSFCSRIFNSIPAFASDTVRADVAGIWFPRGY